MAPNSMSGEAGPSGCAIKSKNSEGKDITSFNN